MSDAPDMLGAFARIFTRPTAADLAAAFAEHHLTQVQLNLSALGRPTIPGADELRGIDLPAIAETFSAHGARLWGLSTTYNMAHPDPTVRTTSTALAATFISRMGGSGAVAATLCSGSRDASNMWGLHPDTSSAGAWRDFRACLDTVIPVAADAGVILAIEPEPANTVADVERALQLRAELGSDAAHIGFILDPANLISHVEPGSRRHTLERAFAELGGDTICVHAKDTVPWADTLSGNGVVDYGLVGELYRSLPEVPFIIQDATEEELPAVSSLIRRAAFGVAP